MIKYIQRYFVTVLIVLVVVLAGSSIYFYKKFSTVQEYSQNPSQEEAKKLADAVGKIFVLPEDEIPTIATVSDPEKLKDQSFFAGAKNGDKVLIYSNAKKAILYDPVSNKIIAVAPLNIGEKQPN